MENQIKNIELTYISDDIKNIKKGFLKFNVGIEIFIIPFTIKNKIKVYEDIPIVFTNGIMKNITGVMKLKDIKITNIDLFNRCIDFIFELKLNDGTILQNIKIENVKQLRDNKKCTYTRTINIDFFGVKQPILITVKIRGRRTTVILPDGIKGTVYCNICDLYNKQEGIKKALYKALSNKFLKELDK